MTIQTSTYRLDGINKLDYDPGYFCKYYRDQVVLNDLVEHRISGILDIGCDTGHIPTILQHRANKKLAAAFSYYGIDINIDNFNPEIKKYPNINLLKVENSTETFSVINNYSLFNMKRKNAVLLLDVIEHMENYEKGLELIDMTFNALINSKWGGVVYISTPNRLSANKNKVNWPKYHEYEYSLNELKNHINTNFKDSIHECYTIGWSMDPKVYLELFNKTIHSGEFSSPNEIERVLEARKLPEYSRDIMMKIKVFPK